jgi:hypothetical protein
MVQQATKPIRVKANKQKPIPELTREANDQQVDLGILGTQFLNKVSSSTAIPLATLREIRKEFNRRFTAILKACGEDEAAQKRARQREKLAQTQAKMTGRKKAKP